MTISRARLLALRPPSPPREELAPRSLGAKGGRPYERRLTLLLQRAWPFLEDALRGAGGTEESIARVADVLFDRQSVERPADDNLAQWQAVERRLESLLTEKGLSLSLACAQLGVSIERLQARCAEDPLLEARLELAYLRGTAKLHGIVWDMASKGNEKLAMTLLQARDSSYVPVQKVEITEAQILSSGAFIGVVNRILGAFSVVVPESSSAEYRAGWLDGLKAAKDKASEELT